MGSFLCCRNRTSDPGGSFLCCRNRTIDPIGSFLSNISKERIWHNIKNIDYKEKRTPHCSSKDTRSWMLVFRSSGERSREATSSRRFGDLLKNIILHSWGNCERKNIHHYIKCRYFNVISNGAMLFKLGWVGWLSTSIAHLSSQARKSSLLMLLSFFENIFKCQRLFQPYSTLLSSFRRISGVLVDFCNPPVRFRALKRLCFSSS